VIIREALSYDDVLLVPKYSDIVSRSEVDIATSLSPDMICEFPVISAPMDTVTEGSMAIAMAEAGGLGIIHRYNSIEYQRQICKAAVRNWHPWIPRFLGAAIGVTGDYLERAAELVSVGVPILCLDIAHGHHILMKEAIEKIKSEYDVHVMAGNVATKKSFEDLSRWGADSIRVGIGGGSTCSTRVQTGHGVPAFQSILDCFRADTKRDVKIIADGGIRTSGDMVKAFAAGADFVMIGSMLAGTTESPGESFVNIDGDRVKNYRGMSSKEAQLNWRGSVGSHEGISTSIPFKGPIEPILEEIKKGIRSGFSYSGATSILELQVNAEFVVQTSSGLVESRTHILDRFNG